MWELDYKESWALKNWCFWTLVLEKTLESCLDCKKIKPVHCSMSRSNCCILTHKQAFQKTGKVVWYCHQFSSVAQSWLTLCDPVDWSMPGFPVHYQLPEFTQTHVHRVGDNHPVISSSVVPFSSCLQSFPASGSFQMSKLFASGGLNIGVSAST